MPWKFFLLAYTLSWLLWLPGLLQIAALPDVAPLAVFGPSVAAFWLTFRQAGRAGLGRLLRRAFQGFSLRWLLVILLLPAVIVSLAGWLSAFWGGQPAAGLWQLPDFLPHPLLLAPYFLFTLLFQGPFGEEFGWRGFALDRLRRRWSPLAASLILGLFWGFWHLPLFLLPTGPHAEHIPFWPFTLSTVPLSILFTWLSQRTGGSLLAAILFHQLINFSLELNPAVSQAPLAFSLMVAGYTLAAIVVIPRLRSASEPAAGHAGHSS